MSLNIIEEHNSPKETMDQVGSHDHKEAVGSEINREHHVEDDPHRAAIDDNPEKPAKLTSATILAVFFLGMSPVAPISSGFLIASSIVVQIGTDLGDTTDIGWIVSGWSIASSVSFGLAGRLSDIFGRRYVIILGNLLAVIGAIVAATADSLNAVIAGSTLLGFSCGLVLVIYAAIPELCPHKYRGLGLAWSEFCIYVPWGTLAVLLGNLLVQHASWRWTYYISIIYAAICFIGTAIFYFPPSRPRHDYEKTRWQEFRELDFVGIALYTAGLVILLVGLSWAGEQHHPWHSASVVAPIVIGVLTFCAFFAYDWLFLKDFKAFAPWHLFVRFREYSVLLIVVFVAGMVFYSMSGLLPQATLYVFSTDGIQIGIITIPNGFGQLVGATLLTATLSITKHPKYHIITAVFLQTLFTGLYAYALPRENKAMWMAFQFFGQGCFPWITVCTLVNSGLHVRQTDLGVAVGIIGVFRSFGGSVGNAVFGAIFRGVLDGQLAPRITEAATAIGYDVTNLGILIPAVIEAGSGVPDAFAGVPGITSAIEIAALAAFKDAYAYAFKMVFYSTVPFGVIALIASLFIADATPYMTNHTSIEMERHVIGHGNKSGRQNGQQLSVEHAGN